MEGITKILPAAVRQQLLRSDDSMLAVLRSLWTSMVGRAIAQQCQPTAFTTGTLTIMTSCPNWAVQFRQLNDEIRQKINRVLGAELVKKLRVRVDPTFKPSELPKPAPGLKGLGKARVKMTQEAAQDALGVLQQSYEKYFSRKGRKMN